MVSGVPILSRIQPEISSISQLRRFTVAEYQRMADLGIFPIGERLGLEPNLCEMSRN
jgi:hypothetical protein